MGGRGGCLNSGTLPGSRHLEWRLVGMWLFGQQGLKMAPRREKLCDHQLATDTLVSWFSSSCGYHGVLLAAAGEVWTSRLASLHLSSRPCDSEAGDCCLEPPLLIPLPPEGC